MLENVRFRAAIAISLGAIAGALGRYYIGLALTSALGPHFPWGTLGVNLSGGLLMGLVTSLVAHRGYVHPEVLLLITTGCLGSYTTFSAYALDTAALGDRPGLLWDFLYWFGSPALGMICLALGLVIGKAISPQHQD